MDQAPAPHSPPTARSEPSRSSACVFPPGRARGPARPPGGSHCAVHSPCVPLPRGRVAPAPRRGFPARGVSPVAPFSGECSLSLLPGVWGCHLPLGCPLARVVLFRGVPVFGVSLVPVFPPPGLSPAPLGTHKPGVPKGLGGKLCCFPHPNGIPAASSAGSWEEIEGFPLVERQSLLCPFVVVCFLPTPAPCAYSSVPICRGLLLCLCVHTPCSSARSCSVFFCSPSISPESFFLYKRNQQILGGYHLFLAC